MEYIEESYPNQFNIVEDEVVVLGKFNMIPNDDGMVEVEGTYKESRFYLLVDSETGPFMINDEKYVIIYDMDEFTRLMLEKIKEAI